MWDHRFFGIADGMVTAIPITTAIPDQNGNFEVTLPDFGPKQTSVKRNSGSP
jgi:hypothetical protein